MAYSKRVLLLENVDNFFKFKGLDISVLDEFIKPVEDQIVFLGGSVAEGYANIESDVDIMVVSDIHTMDGLVLQEEDCHITAKHLPDGTEVTIERYGLSNIKRLAAIMDDCNELMLNPQPNSVIPVITSVSDLKLMHRVRTSINLGNATKLQALREKLRSDLFPKYMLLWNTKLHFAQREDALGEFNSQNFSQMNWLLRCSTLALAKAVLASNGHTHQNERWTIRLLEDSRATIPEADRLIELICGEPVHEKKDIYEWTGFCDTIVSRLLGNVPDLTPVFMHVLAAFPITTTLVND